MPHRVKICIPESCLDDPRWHEVADYDQEEGRLITEGGTVVSVRGVNIQFPRAWLKPIDEKRTA